MSTQSSPETRVMPGGRYCIGLLLLGDETQGQTVLTLRENGFHPADLSTVAATSPTVLVPDEATGAQAGWSWLFQIIVVDVWGRFCLVQEHAAVDRTMDREELATEIARIGPEIYAKLGNRILAMLGFEPIQLQADPAERPALLN